MLGLSVHSGASKHRLTLGSKHGSMLPAVQVGGEASRKEGERGCSGCRDYDGVCLGQQAS